MVSGFEVSPCGDLGTGRGLNLLSLGWTGNRKQLFKRIKKTCLRQKISAREGKRLKKILKALIKEKKTIDFEKITEEFPGKKEDTLKKFYLEHLAHKHSD